MGVLNERLGHQDTEEGPVVTRVVPEETVVEVRVRKSPLLVERGVSLKTSTTWGCTREQGHESFGEKFLLLLFVSLSCPSFMVVYKSDFRFFL